MNAKQHIATLSLKMALWCVLSFIALLLVRAPFLFVYYLPRHLPFEPWIALVPLLCAIWGPPALLGATAAIWCGDHLSGMTSELIPYHVVALTAWGWSTWTLAPRRAPTPSWHAALQWLLATLPGLTVAVAALALGSGMLRLYPFSYVATITFANHLIFLLIFGAVLFKACEEEIVPRLGSWATVWKPKARRPSIYGQWLQAIGGGGALSVGWLLSVRFGYHPSERLFFGDTAGYALLPVVAPFLLLFLFGTLCPPRGTEKQTEQSARP